MQALLDEFLPLYSRTASQRSQKKLADSPFDETFFRKFQFSYPFVILLTSPTSFWRRYFQQWRQQQQQQQQQQSGSQWAVCSCCCAINGAVMAPRRPSICRRQCSDHVDRRKFVPHHAAITPLDYRAAAQRDSIWTDWAGQHMGLRAVVFDGDWDWENMIRTRQCDVPDGRRNAKFRESSYFLSSLNQISPIVVWLYHPPYTLYWQPLSHSTVPIGCCCHRPRI